MCMRVCVNVGLHAFVNMDGWTACVVTWVFAAGVSVPDIVPSIVRVGFHCLRSPSSFRHPLGAVDRLLLVV